MENIKREIMDKIGGSLRLSIIILVNKYDKIKPSDIANALIISRTQVSREIKNLIDDDIIIKLEKKGTFVSLRLTDYGKELVEKLINILIN